ncbi:MAG: hypothetical protein HOH43_06260 [Candidatus Latescibacteria bacterium]|nr:hypothetical protein [Candidatus Latescibacterota bacterium]
MPKLENVNTTDVPSAIALGCRTMSSVFNTDDGNVPFFSSTVLPEAELRFSPAHSEAHVPGRHLNALLNAEDCTGIVLDEDVIEKHAKAAFLAYRGPVALPLNRQYIHGPVCNFIPHNIREGFHALYALVAHRQMPAAARLAERSIEDIFKYWDAERGWNRSILEDDHGLTVSDSTFIIGLARSIGPLVKYYRATQFDPALELALILKEKAVGAFFREDGAYDREIFGTHTHSTTCVMSSLAQLADVTDDMALLGTVRAFYDNGLWEIRDELGWVIEASGEDASPDRGEVNNTGDIVETALILAKHGFTDYYQDVERIVRCHILPSQLRDISFISDSPNPDGEDGKRNVADRHLGAFGFPAPYGHVPIENDHISFNMDIVGGAIGSLCEVHRNMVTSGNSGHRVNLLFDHETPQVSVSSPYTHDCLSIRVKDPGALWVRIPQWIDSKDVVLSGHSGRSVFSNGYLMLPDPPLNRPIDFGFPLAEDKLILRHRTRDINVEMAGDSVTGMSNFGAKLTFFDSL